jgi:hypothetical protein
MRAAVRINPGRLIRQPFGGINYLSFQTNFRIRVVAVTNLNNLPIFI